ncbi:MAG: DUF3857 domain-containing protein [Planctomycetes bacterium]|nr:DUF3857 domain-containing protein [Planctomycetota bacterium]
MAIAGLVGLLLVSAPAAQVPEEVRDAPAAAAFPEADGVVLLEEVEFILDGAGKGVRRHRRLTKLFRDFAIGSGRCDPRIPFDAARQTLEVLACRTWMRDGTPVDTDLGNGRIEVTPFALEHAVDYTNLREIVLVHTGVEHDATLELEYRITDRTPSAAPFWGEWELQSDLPILKQTVVFRVPAGTPLVIQGSRGELVPEKRSEEGVDIHTVVRTNVPPVNLVECAGHEREVVERLVYTTVPSWAEVGTALDRSVSRAVDSSPAIQQCVATLTAGVGTRREQVYRIHDFVARNVRTIRWPLGDFGFEPRSASRVHSSACGHGLDKAVLLKAMLKEAGIEAVVVLASPTTTIAMRAPSPTQLEEVWVAVDDGEERLWLDPSAPLVARSGRDLEGRAILSLVGRGPTVQRVPASAPEDNAAVLTGVCRVGRDGRMTGTLRLDLSGNRNPYHELRGGAAAVGALANRAAAAAVAGARAAAPEVVQLGERATALRLAAEGGEVKRLAGGRLEVALPALPDPLAAADHSLFRNRRTTPLFLAGVARETIEMEIELGAALRLVWAPEPVKLDHPVGRLEIAVAPAVGRTDKLVYRKTFVLKKSIVPPEEYAEFRALMAAQRVRRNSVLLLERVGD